MNAEQAYKTLQDGTILNVKHIVTPNLPSRRVTYQVKDGKPGIFVDTHWFNWDFFFEVNVLGPSCEWCNSYDDVTNEYKWYMLCGSCNEAYDDKSGFCSLDCCIENRCDGSC